MENKSACSLFLYPRIKGEMDTFLNKPLSFQELFVNQQN